MSVTILNGDCREVLKGMADESVNCCVTSPPYWGLRSYCPDRVMLRGDITNEQREAVLERLRDAGVFPVDL